MAAAAAALLTAQGAALAAPIKVAVFPFELYDTSAEGEMNGARPDEAKRTVEITDQVREFLKAKDIELVDVTPAQKDIDAQTLRTCGDCPARMAKSLGADYSLMGYVQKVSNLILNINGEIRNAKTGELVRKGSADIRGNTTESWAHGTSYLMRHDLYQAPLPEPKG
ncbi:DUF3280 domain-containing protein [Hansschlegelia plantiphila]|uniref:DUF2380 domain-containing protein n=1 Tax=Hansschlegelia plantiphila TaxID=374655 RepID=A0A9W6J3C8_9HYPH|nr:DUF3280 domain-containing protein [Hansschlegelia plantiphila]GLK68579.1 hypothetical protein GCM10008179_22170 [Hansschlegelia plantiphila]